MRRDITERDVEMALSYLAKDPPEGLEDRILLATGVADRMTMVPGPIGPLHIVFGDTGVIACVPADRWGEYDGRPVVEVEELPARLATRVEKAITTGKLGALPVDLSSLSEFQRAVLRKTAEIPPGEIRPYGWVAREIGKPGAVRAVGSALNKNPIPILIPCHRVSRSDGHLGQYAYGQAIKRRLLEAEGLDTDAAEALAERGVRYIGSDTTQIFCHPSCRAGARITERHKVEFRSASDATAKGYRACKVCRPAA